MVPLKRTDVWQALNDIEILTKATPGCRELIDEGDGAYRAVIELGIAVVKGRYDGTLRILEPEAPAGYRLQLQAGGRPGSVRADIRIRLSEHGAATRVAYTGTADVSGPVSGLGSGILGGVGRMIFKDFLKTFAREAMAKYER